MQTTRYPNRRLRMHSLLIETLQRGGMRLGSICTLTVRGRASGVLRSTPVLPIEDEGGRWLVATSDAAGWVRNARIEPWAILAHGRRAEIVRLVEVDSTRSTPIVREFAQRLRRRRLASVSGLGALCRSFDDEAAAHPVFELVGGGRAGGSGQ